jgi:hypothetical protein
MPVGEVSLLDRHLRGFGVEVTLERPVEFGMEPSQRLGIVARQGAEHVAEA